MRIAYHPQTSKLKISGEEDSTSSTTTYQQIISVKNTRQIPLQRLIIRDQIPVSHDERVAVRVLQPRELLLVKNKGQRQPAPHSTDVYWIRRNGEPIKTHDSGDSDIGALGLIEWVKKVDARASVDIDLVWEVKASTDVKWVDE